MSIALPVQEDLKKEDLNTAVSVEPKPAEPKPADPVKPVEPKPVDPAKPADPVKPVDPANPTDPKPEEPAEDLQISSDQIQQVIDSITELLDGRKITTALIVRVIANCMIVTAKMKVQNHLKKKIVIYALEQYIRKRANLSQSDIDSIMAVVDVVISDTIDTISDVKKGHINLDTKACCLVM